MDENQGRGVSWWDVRVAMEVFQKEHQCSIKTNIKLGTSSATKQVVLFVEVEAGAIAWLKDPHARRIAYKEFPNRDQKTMPALIHYLLYLLGEKLLQEAEKQAKLPVDQPIMV